MAVTERTFSNILIHGSGVPNSYCGDYPNIQIGFKIIFDRTGANNNQQIVWHTEGITWTHPTSGRYGYNLFVYIQVNDGTPQLILSKNNTQESNWWNTVTVSNVGETSFLSTSNSCSVKILVKSNNTCQHNGQYCYRGTESIGGENYTCLYNFSDTQLPSYTTYYTVSYNANGGINPPASQQKASNAPLTLTSEVPLYPVTVRFHNGSGWAVTDTIYPSKQFSNWYCTASTTPPNGSIFDNEGATYNYNVAAQMVAQWGFTSFTTLAIPKKYVTITFNAKGGTVSPGAREVARDIRGYSTSPSSLTPSDPYPPQSVVSINVPEGSNTLDLYPWYDTAKVTAASLPTPTRSGYRFTGWYVDSECQYKIIDTFGTTDDTTIYAGWTPVASHKFDSSGKWVDGDAYVWRFNGTQWQKVAPIYKFDGSNWINISGD